MSALRRLRQTDADINFKPWIFEIARNAAIDQYRRNVRTDEVSIDIEGGFAPPRSRAWCAPAARTPRCSTSSASTTCAARSTSFGHATTASSSCASWRGSPTARSARRWSSRRPPWRARSSAPAASSSTSIAQLDTGRRCQLMRRHGPAGGGVRVRAATAPASTATRAAARLPGRARQLGLVPELPRRRSPRWPRRCHCRSVPGASPPRPLPWSPPWPSPAVPARSALGGSEARPAAVRRRRRPLDGHRRRGPRAPRSARPRPRAGVRDCAQRAARPRPRPIGRTRRLPRPRRAQSDDIRSRQAAHRAPRPLVSATTSPGQRAGSAGGDGLPPFLSADR